MSLQNDNGFKRMVAGGTITAFSRVKLNSTTDRSVVVAGAGEDSIGVAQEAASSGDQVTVKLWSAPGTFKVAAGAAMATRNAAVYGAASGLVSNTVSGELCGYQLDTATGSGGVVEIVPAAAQVTSAANVASIDNDAGGTTGGTEQLNAICAAIDNDAGGTTGGTEQLNAICAAIDDTAGGTTGGTEKFALASAAIAEGTLGGTTGGTELMSKVAGTGYSAGAVASISNNLQVLFTEFNDLRTDVANNLKVISTEFNEARTGIHNNLKVISTEFNEARTGIHNNLKVVTTQINAIITALKNAGLMKAS